MLSLSMGAHLDKATAIGATVAPLLPALLNNDLSTPVLGVQMTTVMGALLGTFAAIGYDPRSMPRGKLIMLAPSTVIIAAAAVGVFPRWLGWTWASGNVEAGLGALAAVVIYYLLPPAIKRAGELIAEFKLTDYLPAKWRQAAEARAVADNAPAPTEGDPDK